MIIALWVLWKSLFFDIWRWPFSPLGPRLRDKSPGNFPGDFCQQYLLYAEKGVIVFYPVADGDGAVFFLIGTDEVEKLAGGDGSGRVQR